MFDWLKMEIRAIIINIDWPRQFGTTPTFAEPRRWTEKRDFMRAGM